MPECCEFPQWSCSAENNESNSCPFPTGPQTGPANKDSRVTVALLFYTQQRFPLATPSGDIGLCLCVSPLVCVCVTGWLQLPWGAQWGVERWGRWGGWSLFGSFCGRWKSVCSFSSVIKPLRTKRWQPRDVLRPLFRTDRHFSETLCKMSCPDLFTRLYFVLFCFFLSSDTQKWSWAVMYLDTTDAICCCLCFCTDVEMLRLWQK